MKKIIISIIVLLGIAGGYKYFKDNQTNNSSSFVSKVSVSTTTPKYTLAQVIIHNKKSDCWTTVNDYVYDVTEYIPNHPGGEEIIKVCGKDGTELFESEREHSESNAQATLDSYFIGILAQ